MGYNYDDSDEQDAGMEADGIVKSMRKDRTAILMEVNLATGSKESWCDLAPEVMPFVQNVKTGTKCHFKYISTGDGNPLITFIRFEKTSYSGASGSATSPYPKKPYSPTYNQTKKEEYAPTEETYRMSACKSAAQVFGNAVSTSEPGKIIQDFKKLSVEILAFIKTGKFDSDEKKPVSKSELFGPEDQSNY